MSNNKQLNVLIIGSSNFEDKGFVFGVLDTFNSQFSNLFNGVKVGNVYSSGYTKISDFAKEWAGENKANFVLHNFYAEGRDNPLFENFDLPEVVLKNDPFFTKGKDFLMEKNISMVITLPNMQGELGPRTHHISNMAKLAGILVMPANELYKQILETKQSILEEKEQLNKDLSFEKTIKDKNRVTDLSSLSKI